MKLRFEPASVEAVSAACRKRSIRTGSDAIAPSSAARWEIDLSGGAAGRPESPLAGSKRSFNAYRSRPNHREAEVGDQRLRAGGVLIPADPQRNHPLAVVLRW